MGVVTAVPLSEYEILSVDITKIGETKRMKRSPKQSTLERAVGAYERHRPAYVPSMLCEIFNRDYILITHVATGLFHLDAVTLFKMHVQY